MFFKKVVCVERMITHMYDETKKMVKDSTSPDNFFFYHNALSLMTSNETVNWMKEKGYYKHWLVPYQGLNDGTRFAKHPPRDSPELMPMDNVLNYNLDTSVLLHVAYNRHLKNDDPSKFSLSTPSEGKRAYFCIWDLTAGVSLSSERIVEDIHNFIPTLEAIMKSKGTVIDEKTVGN